MIWITPARGRAFGCTHRARLFGIVPGYLDPETGLWVAVTPALAPVEWVLTLAWVWTRQLRGEAPDFMWHVGGPL